MSFCQSSITEPVGIPEVLLDEHFEGIQFNKTCLESFLNSVDKKLDILCERFIKQEFSVVDYNLSIYNQLNKKLVGEIVEGMFFLLVSKNEAKHSVRMFKTNYQRSFEKIRDKYHGEFLESEMYVLGFREGVPANIL